MGSLSLLKLTEWKTFQNDAPVHMCDFHSDMGWVKQRSDFSTERSTCYAANELRSFQLVIQLNTKSVKNKCSDKQITMLHFC